ncbi:MAG TPA: M55 family metallopeptidase [Actinopolymorphaceae bacterium]
MTFEGATVRVLISVDMEGVAGVVDPADVTPGQPEYERNRELMTDEANAAIAGVLAYTMDAQILVADAHANFRNLLPSRLGQEARLVRGKPRAFGMLAGIESNVDAVVFVGYHGKAGTPGSVLAHTMSSAVVPGIRTVVVKRALGCHAAENLHPVEACRRITEAVERGLKESDQIAARRYDGAVVLEVDVLRPGMADLAALLVPGLERLGGCTLRYEAPDITVAYRMVSLIAVLGRS